MKWFFLIVLLLTPFLAVSSFAQEEAFPLPEPLFVEAIADPDLPPPPIEFLEEVAAEPPPKIWSGGLELGFNGADGNSNLFKIRFAGNVKRDTPENVFLMDFVYGYAKAMGEDTENRALLNARDEIPFPDSPWSVFGSTNIE